MFRVIWRTTAVPGALRTEAVADEELTSGLALIGDPEPVFTPPAAAFALAEGVEVEAPEPPGPFNHGFVASLEEAEELRHRLLGRPEVVSVEIQPRLTRPVRLSDPAPNGEALGVARLSAAAPTRDYRPLQRYLEPAPHGVGASSSWNVPGGNAAGVHVLDLEFGWSPDHEDLRHRGIRSFYGADPPPDEEHGTAVLGILTAEANGYGIQGIAHAATARFGSVEYDDGTGRWNVSDAIYRAASLHPPGSVILIELQGSGPKAGPNPNDSSDDQFGSVPVEWWEVDFLAIRWATARGFHVVEAAGNGSQDLDAPVYRRLLSRGGRDSGAILVGAGASAWSSHPRSCLPFSNFGSRLDVQAWGEQVVTCGGDAEPHYDQLKSDPADPRRWYTNTFGGTSSASAVVAGVVAAVAGRRSALGRPRLTAAAMRDLLTRTGTPQADAPGRPAGAQRIGPLPDIVRAFGEI